MMLGALHLCLTSLILFTLIYDIGVWALFILVVWGSVYYSLSSMYEGFSNTANSVTMCRYLQNHLAMLTKTQLTGNLELYARTKNVIDNRRRGLLEIVDSLCQLIDLYSWPSFRSRFNAFLRELDLLIDNRLDGLYDEFISLWTYIIEADSVERRHDISQILQSISSNLRIIWNTGERSTRIRLWRLSCLNRENLLDPTSLFEEAVLGILSSTTIDRLLVVLRFLDTPHIEKSMKYFVNQVTPAIFVGTSKAIMELSSVSREVFFKELGRSMNKAEAIAFFAKFTESGDTAKSALMRLIKYIDSSDLYPIVVPYLKSAAFERNSIVRMHSLVSMGDIGIQMDSEHMEILKQLVRNKEITDLISLIYCIEQLVKKDVIDKDNSFGVVKQVFFYSDRYVHIKCIEFLTSIGYSNRNYPFLPRGLLKQFHFSDDYKPIDSRLGMLEQLKSEDGEQQKAGIFRLFDKDETRLTLDVSDFNWLLTRGGKEAIMAGLLIAQDTSPSLPDGIVETIVKLSEKGESELIKTMALTALLSLPDGPSVEEMILDKIGDKLGSVAMIPLSRSQTHQTVMWTCDRQGRRDTTTAIHACLAFQKIQQKHHAIVPSLMKRYDGAEYRVRIMILETLGVLGDTSCIAFVGDAYNNEQNPLVIATSLEVLDMLLEIQEHEEKE